MPKTLGPVTPSSSTSLRINSARVSKVGPVLSAVERFFALLRMTNRR
jgi:hypothetical protein